MGLRLGRYGDPHMVDIGLAEHRVKSVRATAAPTPNAHPGQVDVRTGAGELFMERPPGIRREVVVVRAGLVQGGDSFGLSSSTQAYTVEIFLGRIVR